MWILCVSVQCSSLKTQTALWNASHFCRQALCRIHCDQSSLPSDPRNPLSEMVRNLQDLNIFMTGRYEDKPMKSLCKIIPADRRGTPFAPAATAKRLFHSPHYNPAITSHCRSKLWCLIICRLLSASNNLSFGGNLNVTPYCGAVMVSGRSTDGTF